MRAKVNSQVVSEHTRYGVLAIGPPTIVWFVGSFGSCEWLIGTEDVPARKIGDPQFRVLVEDSRRDPDMSVVDAILCQGFQPGNEHWVWRTGGVRAIGWVASRRRNSKAPLGWTLHRRVLRHDRLGGVTDGVFEATIAIRSDSDVPRCGRTDVMFPNSLRQIWRPTETGRHCLSGRSGEDGRITVDGLLSWKVRLNARIEGPTVFSKTHWVSRRLVAKELADVLDLPSDRVRTLDCKTLDRVMTHTYPGKVLSQLFRLLVWSEKRVRSGVQDNEVRSRKRLHVNEPLEANKRVRFAVSDTPLSMALDVTSLTVTTKAVKADDAEVPKYLWDTRVLACSSFDALRCAEWDHKAIQACDVLRRCLLRFWKRKVERSFVEWFGSRSHDVEQRDEIYRSGMQACIYAWRASWFEWLGGSAIFFWRWPDEWMEDVRLGVPPFFDKDPPHSMERQPPYKDLKTKEKVMTKVWKVIDRGYITTQPPRPIKSLMYMFDVPKGSDDIRMVYDGSKSGLNATLWAPWFALPTVDAMCRGLLPGYYCGDNDYGEQFLNFPLHPLLQQFCGVDLSQLRRSEPCGDTSELFGMWMRNAMGLRPSPYGSVMGATRAKRFILGDRRSRSNPFQWDHVELNQPGDRNYNPNRPWLMKKRLDGELATELHQFIDDLRTTGKDAETVWLASSTIGKELAHKGLQDAARKRRPPSQTPGAWAGASVRSTTDGVFKSVTEDRWRKAQVRIREIGYQIGLWDDTSTLLLDRDELENRYQGRPSSQHILHKESLSHRGFLVYVANTFKAIVPYLKGLHLTLDGWRPYRDEDGWKLSVADRKLNFDMGDKPPVWVKAVPRLKADLAVLMDFTSVTEPPQIPARPTCCRAIYLVGDASGSGFGTSVWEDNDRGVNIGFGAWTSAISKDRSSNFREAYNLVLQIEDMSHSGSLINGTELWVFTDNSVAEFSFTKGTSSDKLLHELIVRIRRLEMQGAIFPRFVWIAGTRMIAQGTDGLSRGDLTTGVMGGDEFLSHLPLNLSVLTRAPEFKHEIGDWFLDDSQERMIWLDESGWFEEAFGDPNGIYVWTPSPALATVAVEQLCEVNHVHPGTSHIFICPALLTGGWRRPLRKQSDALLTLPANSSCWNCDQHEPIVVSLTCPLLPHRPWRVKRTDWIDGWQKKMQGVWCHGPDARRTVMREFWHKAGRTQR